MKIKVFRVDMDLEDVDMKVKMATVWLKENCSVGLRLHVDFSTLKKLQFSLSPW